jgi:hypothetical protein
MFSFVKIKEDLSVPKYTKELIVAAAKIEKNIIQ